jgi:hypothetical protein
MKKYLAQFLGFRITGCKALSVNLTHRADESVAVLVADFAVVVAVAIVETCLAHAALLVPRERQHPPAGTYWQSCAATHQNRTIERSYMPWSISGAGQGLLSAHAFAARLGDSRPNRWG